MSIAYMLALEAEPNTYEKYFTTLTKGVNKKIQNWILDKITPDLKTLEVGCGPGFLARKIAEKGGSITAFDAKLEMVMFALKSIDPQIHKNIKFLLGSAIKFPEDLGEFDIIISTFMLSELRPFEQQIFLRNAWNHLKSNGTLIIADEFVPTGVSKISFKLKRLWYKRKLKRVKSDITHPLKWFLKYLEPIGFKIQRKKKWTHGSIRLYEIIKVDGAEAGYYRPPIHKFTGIKAKANIARCLLTGQIDHVAIEPGIYKSGNPSSNSPVIVTANYEYTYIRVMNDLKGIDAWVLCVDSNGINVWCAARGGDFGNKQLIEAVQASDISRLVKHNTLILPQLAAGGVSIPQLPQDFPFKIKYGPIWSKSLKTYLKEIPARKSEEMKLARFTFSKRAIAGITHLTFLIRKFLFWPTILSAIAILALFFINPYIFRLIDLHFFYALGWIWLSVIFTNLFIAFVFPIVNFTRAFIKKGLILSIFSSIIDTLFFWLLFQSLTYCFANFAFLFWLGFFSTMSFSGYTMDSSPRRIKAEYPNFKNINRILLIVAIIIYIGTLVLEII